MMRDIETILLKAGITPTPIRKILLKSLYEASMPLSLSDLEIKLESIDKSTLSRTLSIFKKKHMLHSINDGSGSVKYEVCRNHDDVQDYDRHVHFRCEICGRTSCLEDLKVPEVVLPEGYLGKDVNYVVSGLCPSCVMKENE